MPDRIKADIGVINRGFQPAIDFFRQKLNLPTATWRDLQHGMHARAFVVAGAMKEDLVTDLRNAVDAAIAEGESYDSFKARFRDIVKRHGWQHTGSPGWRSRVIYHTNTRTAFAAGRYAQMLEPAVLAHMPYWLYDHTTIVNPREQHQAWDNRVWLASDPIWKVIYPPNGWGCNCRVRPLSRRQLEKMGKTGPDPTPKKPKDGIPPEWQYNVGEAAYGLPPAQQKLTGLKGSPWAQLGTALDGSGTDRPARLTPRPIEGAVDDPATWPGGKQIFSRQFDNGFRYDLVADAAQLRDVADELRPLVAPMLDSPDEVYLSFVKHKTTGKVALQLRVIRAIVDPRKPGESVVLVLDAQGGQFVAIDAVLASSAALEILRAGILLHAEPAP